MNAPTQETPLEASELTQALCETLLIDIDATLKALGEAHGVKLAIGTLTYSEERATARLTILPLGGNPNAVHAVGFERWAAVYGLKSADLGLDVDIHGKAYTILGLKPRATKRPMVLRRADGEIYAFPVETVREALGRPPMTATEERDACIARAMIKIETTGK